jgi:hypothetical protein
MSLAYDSSQCCCSGDGANACTKQHRAIAADEDFLARCFWGTKLE